ncbi:MAG TPA: hypothetical protein VJT49_11285 [Amycolatopsis sp.]|uniref:hypothetical protein n=1 Tax=Amycolatopsis sp. TaxID=37632 RepID=UPI002B467D90|nr:hypothetical protein [Amycolatopsis sp.]HKS45673.1 hypothetical protein [Amycolatopsis sp.]
MVTDARARVLRADGSGIRGRYAAARPSWEHGYAMTFGYIAGTTSEERNDSPDPWS